MRLYQTPIITTTGQQDTTRFKVGFDFDGAHLTKRKKVIRTTEFSILNQQSRPLPLAFSDGYTMKFINNSFSINTSER